MHPHVDEAQPWAWLQALRVQPATEAARSAAAPVATRLTVAGVAVALQTWRHLPDERSLPGGGGASGGADSGSPATEPNERSRWPHREADAVHGRSGGSSRPAPAAVPVLFAAGEPAGGRRLPPREHSGEASRRRKRARAPQEPQIPTAPHKYQQHPAHDSPRQQPQWQQQPPLQREQQQGQSPAPAGDAALGLHFSGRPAAEYLILQQWGLEATLAVLPPGACPDSAADAAAATGRPPGLRQHSPAVSAPQPPQQATDAASAPHQVHEMAESSSDDGSDGAGVGATSSTGDGKDKSGRGGGGRGPLASPSSDASWSIPAADSGADPGQTLHAASEPAAAGAEGASLAAAAAAADTRLRSADVGRHHPENEQRQRQRRQQPGISRADLPTGAHPRATPLCSRLWLCHAGHHADRWKALAFKSHLPPEILSLKCTAQIH